MKNKILLTSNTSWSVYKFRHGLMYALQKEGFDVSFCAKKDSYTDKLEKEFTFHEIHIDRRGKNPLKDLKLIFDFYKIYKRENPGLVIHYTIKPNIYGTIAAKIARVKSINVVTGMGSVFINKGILSSLVKKLYKISFKFAEKTFFLNRDNLSFFLKNKIVEKEETILLPGEGINTELFSPRFCKEGPKKFTFLYTGRILKEKGIIELINAFKSIKEKHPSKLILVGKTDDKNPSVIKKKEIDKWKEENIIDYYEEVEDIRKFICKSDCIVLPSYKEGLPRSLLEALSMGKVVITTDIPGCRDLVEGILDNFLIKPKDVDDLREKMIEMIKISSEEREVLGKKLREKMIKGFNEKIVTEKYLEVINNLKQK